jgi:hypothetical protein
VTPADPDPFDLSAYRAWRAEHPTRPLPRDVEEALVAEVERQLARISDLVHGYTFARDKGKALERAAVVAYMRGDDTYCEACRDYAVSELAHGIEMGKHREGDK